MAKHRALLAMLMATQAMATDHPVSTTPTPDFNSSQDQGEGQHQGQGSRSPVNLTNITFVTVKKYPNASMCADPPTSVEFWPVNLCMPVPPSPNGPPGPVMHSMAKLDEVVGSNGMIGAYMTALYGDGDDKCRPENKMPDSDGVAATRECAEYCDREGVCEQRKFEYDESVGTGYMQYFNTSNCSDAGGPMESRYFPVDLCMPVGPTRQGHAIKSRMQWLYPGTPGHLQVHHFEQEGCRGEHLPANVSDMRTVGGVCTMFPMGGGDNMGYMSYKLWAHKRFGQNTAPRCAWIPRKLAEEINAIPHPDPNSASCMAGQRLGSDNNGMRIVYGADHMDDSMTDGHMDDDMTAHRM
mmetsp:Transcript_20483/g.61062  ORF Transcript_20483/g.61062 Transcript_20483/m.61062 type:complete len:353 (+) Transcript_20483:93-1151(+)